METLHGSIITLVFSISRWVGLFPMYHSAKIKEYLKKKEEPGVFINKELKKKKKKILIVSKKMKQQQPVSL